jgi:NTE family protein
LNNNNTNNSRTALVLGGGGSLGNAWLIGVIAGLFDAGLDVTTADLTVGTSAGSTAAAQIAGASPAELYADILEAPTQHPGAAGPMRPTTTHQETSNAVIQASHDPSDMRRRMGAWALGMDAASDPSAQARWRATVASRFSRHDWPERRMLMTAVDADTGAPVVFDRESGIELVDAVAASCAGGFAYRIHDRRYLDGGYRTNADNADLAAGYGRVLVLSPFGGRTRLPLEWGLDLATQVTALRTAGSRVETIFPSPEALAIFGDNMMNLAARPAAARAGFKQGAALAAPLADLWT